MGYNTYYIATDFTVDGYMALYKEWFKDVISADKVMETPENVSVTMRFSETDAYVFIMNFNSEEKAVSVPFGYEVLSGEFDNCIVAPYGTVILKKANK